MIFVYLIYKIFANFAYVNFSFYVFLLYYRYMVWIPLFIDHYHRFSSEPWICEGEDRPVL